LPILGNDPGAARANAERIWDRTPGTEPAVQMANQMGMVFAKLNCKPRWRKRLPELAIPALVVHGRRDPFFPVGNGEAIAREIPGPDCSCSKRPPPRSLTRPPARSRRRCSRSRPPWIDPSTGKLDLNRTLPLSSEAEPATLPWRDREIGWRPLVSFS
jgi:hypothetical protein